MSGGTKRRKAVFTVLKLTWGWSIKGGRHRKINVKRNLGSKLNQGLLSRGEVTAIRKRTGNLKRYKRLIAKWNRSQDQGLPILFGGTICGKSGPIT